MPAELPTELVALTDDESGLMGRPEDSGHCGAAVEALPIPINDSWMRDNGLIDSLPKPSQVMSNAYLAGRIPR